MTVIEMTGAEMRATNPTKELLYQAVELLVSQGWIFKASHRPSAEAFEGWWINDSHPTKNRPVGDSKNFHFSAWDTVKAYLKS